MYPKDSFGGAKIHFTIAATKKLINTIPDFIQLQSSITVAPDSAHGHCMGRLTHFLFWLYFGGG